MAGCSPGGPRSLVVQRKNVESVGKKVAGVEADPSTEAEQGPRELLFLMPNKSSRPDELQQSEIF